jgi:hypothetical protein
LLKFHVNHASSVAEKREDLSEAVTLLKHSLDFVDSQEGIALVRFHADRLQKLAGDDEELEEALRYLGYVLNFAT